MKKNTHENGCFTQSKAIKTTTKGNDFEQYI